MEKKRILIGNSFPLSLVRRDVRIEVSSLACLREAAHGCEVVSYWGHENTLGVVESWSGLPLRPPGERPALRLHGDGLIEFDGVVYGDCWVLSPDYRRGYRPSVGVEVQVEDILSWQVLHITWE